MKLSHLEINSLSLLDDLMKLKQSLLKTDEIVLGELNKLLTMVRGNEEEFVKRVMSNSVQRKSSELTKAKKTLKQAQKCIAELDKLFTRFYEDNVLGRLSDERFTMMSAGYEEE